MRNNTKKHFLLSSLLSLALASLLVAAPHRAGASWFGKDSPAASLLSSFWQKVILPVVSLPIKLPGKIPGLNLGGGTPNTSVTQANCVPPVPPKPAVIDARSRYGLLTVTPEISAAGPNNIVTISLSSDLEEVNSVSIYTPFPADLNDDVVDWYPKEARGVSFSRANYSGNGEFRWGISSIAGKYQKYNYGVRIRMQDATIQKQAKNATDADGWRKISYTVSGLKPGRIPTVEKGSRGFYVGREQKPSLITTIGKDNFKKTFYSGSPSLKPFTAVPNGYFEIQTKSLGQPGTIAMKVENAKIIGGEKIEVKADEAITWKIQPLGTDAVRLLELSLKNSCGEDYFIDPALSSPPVIYAPVVPKKSEPQTKPPAPTPKPALPEQSQKVFPQNLTVSPSRTLDGLKEGDKVTFTAKVLLSDNSTKIVKDGVKWTVAGKIGSITAAGVFEAKLDESIAEFGEGVGAVAATYKDASGASFTATSPIFKVELFVPAGGGEG